MKIRIVGNNDELEKKINNITHYLPDVTLEVSDELKLNIKKTPAIIIENVLIDNINELSDFELKNVILQFFET